MEFPDYLLNTAKRRRYLQALEKLPSVIAQMAAHEGIRIRDYLLSVRMQSISCRVVCGAQRKGAVIYLPSRAFKGEINCVCMYVCDLKKKKKVVSITAVPVNMGRQTAT